MRSKQGWVSLHASSNGAVLIEKVEDAVVEATSHWMHDRLHTFDHNDECRGATLLQYTDRDEYEAALQKEAADKIRGATKEDLAKRHERAGGVLYECMHKCLIREGTELGSAKHPLTESPRPWQYRDRESLRVLAFIDVDNWTYVRLFLTRSKSVPRP